MNKPIQSRHVTWREASGQTRSRLADGFRRWAAPLSLFLLLLALVSRWFEANAEDVTVWALEEKIASEASAASFQSAVANIAGAGMAGFLFFGVSLLSMRMALLLYNVRFIRSICDALSGVAVRRLRSIGRFISTVAASAAQVAAMMRLRCVWVAKTLFWGARLAGKGVAVVIELAVAIPASLLLGLWLGAGWVWRRIRPVVVAATHAAQRAIVLVSRHHPLHR